MTLFILIVGALIGLGLMTFLSHLFGRALEIKAKSGDAQFLRITTLAMTVVVFLVSLVFVITTGWRIAQEIWPPPTIPAWVREALIDVEVKPVLPPRE